MLNVATGFSLNVSVFCRLCCVVLSCVVAVGTSVSDGANGRRMDCEIERSNLQLLKTSAYIIYFLCLKPRKWYSQDAFFLLCGNR